MNEASKIVPPPPAAIPEQKPKALAEQPKSLSETKELPGPASGTGDKKEPPKQVPAEPPTQLKANSNPELNKNPTIGTDDIKKP